MKKTLLSILIVLLVAVIAVPVYAELNSKWVAGSLVFFDSTTGTAVVTISPTAVTPGATYVQADTNVTTTVTLYTPRYIGDHLHGGAGTGTNGIWEAVGVTTNDWVLITQ